MHISDLTWLMFGTLFIALMMGLPLAFVTGGLGVVFIYLVGEQTMLNIIPSRFFQSFLTLVLLPIPLLIFWAPFLDFAGSLYKCLVLFSNWWGW